MKHTALRFLCVVIVLCLSVPFWGSQPANAMDYRTESISDEFRDSFLEEMEFEWIQTPDATPAIEWFAISDSGQIALGGHISETAVIYVYGTNGLFLYGCRFINNNCALVIFFEDDDLSIHWAKSDYVGTFDASGNCLFFAKVKNEPVNYDLFNKYRYPPSEGTVGDCQYKAEGATPLSLKYIRFFVTDQDGNERLIYDATSEYQLSVVRVLFLLAVFFFVVKLYMGDKIYFMGHKINIKNKTED